MPGFSWTVLTWWMFPSVQFWKLTTSLVKNLNELNRYFCFLLQKQNKKRFTECNPAVGSIFLLRLFFFLNPFRFDGLSHTYWYVFWGLKISIKMNVFLYMKIIFIAAINWSFVSCLCIFLYKNRNVMTVLEYECWPTLNLYSIVLAKYTYTDTVIKWHQLSQLELPRIVPDFPGCNCLTLMIRFRFQKVPKLC